MRWLAFVLALQLAATGAGWAQVHEEAVLKAVGLEAKTFRDRGDGVLWEGRVAEPRGEYLRLHFTEVVVPSGVSLTVAIRDAEGRTLARYSASQLRAAPSFYTDVLHSDVARVQVNGTLPLDGVSFWIDQALVGMSSQRAVVPQSVFAKWKDVADVRSRISGDVIAAVAKLFVGSGVTCTGFLVTPQAVLTNFHCLDRSPAFRETRDRPTAECGDIRLHFDFDRQPQPDATTRAICLRVLKADPVHDYALLDLGVAVPPPAGQRARRPLRLAEVVSATTAGYLVHHPQGLAKKVSLECAVLPRADGLIQHKCDSVKGSSGSPLLDANHQVVGLHFKGALPPNMTLEQYEDLIARGVELWNEAQPAPVLREQLRGLLP